MAKAADVEISDGTLRYMERSQPLHALLKRALTQASACVLAAIMKSGTRLQTEAALDLAGKAIAQALDEIRSLNVPGEADHHHHHMLGAAHEIEATIGMLVSRRGKADEETSEQLSQRLRAATAHLRAASKLMPGHPMVDLSQACCALHARELIQKNA